VPPAGLARPGLQPACDEVDNLVPAMQLQCGFCTQNGMHPECLAELCIVTSHNSAMT